MIDLKLDPATHDIILSNFTLATTFDLVDEITQRLKIKLLWFKGEWGLNVDYGIPYFQEIFIKGIDLSEIDNIFKIAIAEEEGVKSIVSYSSVFDATTRELTIKTKLLLANGSSVSITIPL